MAKKVKLKSDALVNTISVFGEQESNEVIAIKPNKYKISFSMYASMDEDIDNIQKLSINQNISYQRIMHLLKYYINDCLWYDMVSARCIEKHFTATDNVFLITPEVNITYFTNCLYAKFNSICLPNIVVDSIQVLDTDTNITYDYEDTEGEIPDFLPLQDEFMGERSIYDEPWWARNDISTYDNFAINEEELKAVKEELADKKDMLDADFNAIDEEVRNQMTQAGIVPDGEVVDIEEFRKKRKKWVPKIVK